MAMFIIKRKIRLAKNKKNTNRKVTLSKREKKTNKSKKSIDPKTKRINLKRKLKIDPPVRKNLRNDIISSTIPQSLEK